MSPSVALPLSHTTTHAVQRPIRGRGKPVRQEFW